MPPMPKAAKVKASTGLSQFYNKYNIIVLDCTLFGTGRFGHYPQFLRVYGACCGHPLGGEKKETACFPLQTVQARVNIRAYKRLLRRHIMSQKRKERSKELDRRRKRREERLKVRIKEAKAAKA